MRGHIHKRVRRNAAGKETVRWYVVVDVGIDESGRRKQRWHGGFDTRREAEVERCRSRILNPSFPEALEGNWKGHWKPRAGTAPRRPAPYASKGASGYIGEPTLIYPHCIK